MLHVSYIFWFIRKPLKVRIIVKNIYKNQNKETFTQFSSYSRVSSASIVKEIHTSSTSTLYDFTTWITRKLNCISSATIKEKIAQCHMHKTLRSMLLIKNLFHEEGFGILAGDGLELKLLHLHNTIHKGG